MSSNEKIRQTAQDLFYRNGYLATSVDEIIAQAGVSKSNFYYHFKSKEDLGIAVLDQRRRDFQLMLERTLLDSALSPKERLTAFMDQLVDAQESRFAKGGCPFGNLIAEMTEHSERFRCHLSEMFGGLTALLADLVAEGQRRGQLRSEFDAGDVAALIVQTTEGMHLMTKCHKSVETFGRCARLLIRLIEAK
jgi:TetR/AcrR family transcriptional repressor of nem operon